MLSVTDASKISVQNMRFSIRIDETLRGCITVLHDEQMVLERLHSGFASCTKGSCSRNNLGLKLLQVDFASCTI